VLRDYQDTLLLKVHDALDEQDGHVVAVAPCGAGKSVMLAHEARECGVPNVTIAHRRELVWQISAAYCQAGIYHRIVAPEPVINSVCAMHMERFGERFYRPGADVAVASVDTMIRRANDPFFAACRRWQVDECFPAGTLVDGRPIEALAVGDRVRAFNEATGRIEPREIVRLFKNPAPRLMVRLATEHRVLHCTSNHPIWTRRGWLPAAALKKGDRVLIDTIGWQRLESVEIVECYGDGFVYNLEVEELHTYTANGFVVHNCHHLQPDNKWGRAALMCPNARGIGWSATPERADRKPLRAMFGAMVIGPTVRELIDRGYLADYRIYGLPQAIDTSNVRIAGNGDYNANDLSGAARASAIVGDIVQTYLKYARGLSGVTFAVDLGLADEHAQAFREAGVSAAVLSSETKDADRIEIVRAFRAKELDQIVNVDILGEGFDAPGIEVASLARPTMSKALCIQQMMRPMRPNGPKVALILDHVGNIKHGLPDTHRVWSLDAPERKKGVARLEVTIRVCGACLQPYEGFEPACPFCGAERERPERNRPEAVEGDLTLYTPELLAQLRGDVARISGPEQIPFGMDGFAAAGLSKQWSKRQEAQAALSAAIDLWAGQWAARGESIRAIYMRFYATFGMDTLSALAQSGPKMREMVKVVEEYTR